MYRTDHDVYLQQIICINNFIYMAVIGCVFFNVRIF